MIKNYIKIAWRNIIKSKGYSGLNILGLAIGMAVALLIGLWAYNEYSYDKFLPNHRQLYRVQRNFNSNGDTLTFPTTSLKLANALRNQVPEIEYVAEADWMGPHGLMAADKKLYMPGGIVGADFLKMFRYPLLQGNADNVLKDAYSIVLTQATAKALFGNENVVGKTLRFDNKHDLKVTGILKNISYNSTLQFNFLVPFAYLEQTDANVRERRNGSFGFNSYQQFVQLKSGVAYAEVAPKIKDIEKTEKDNGNAMLSDVILQPLAHWHLYGNYVNGKETGGFLKYVRMFSIIGLLVLLIACINFINLATARSEKRAKEVGVRKAIGCNRKDLVIQFLTESFLLTFIAFIFSLLFVQLALPTFNSLTGNEVSIPFLNGTFWAIMICSVFITAFAAGSRPAFYLSSFQPVKVLKGAMLAGRAATLPRKVLVVLQFSCSIALIISTVVIYKQVQFAKDRPIGFDVNRLLVTDINDDLSKSYTALKNDLLQKGIGTNMASASSPADNVNWHAGIDQWPGKNEGETIEMGMIITSGEYFKTLGMTMLEGRDFANPSDTLNIIFNEAAVKRMRLKNPLNQVITVFGTQVKIIGVVKDALMLSPFAPADPTLFAYDLKPQGNLMYRLAAGIETKEAITKLTALFNKYNPSYPYEYNFADQRYAAKYKLEILIGKLAGFFASLAIFISCLGLFGLAAYIAEQRTKEIGIRKVLGASIPQVWLLLSKDFIVLVLISCVIASPISLYFLQKWLQNYDYRISIGAGVFVASALAAIFVTIITISFQAIKAANANPVKSLKTE